MNLVNATFSMVGKNPPAIMIVGGILFLLIGGMTMQTQAVNSSFFVSTGGALFGFGIALHLMWLFIKRRW